MSQEIISSVQIILKGLLSNDNNVRNEASAKLEEMRKNTSLLLVCLINILHGKIIKIIITLISSINS